MRTWVPMRADVGPELWLDFLPASGLVEAVARSHSAAEALLWVALAGQGARLVPGGVVHDGRRLEVAVGDAAAEGVFVVSTARCLRAPGQAALDVLVACRERGKVVQPPPWWEREGAVEECLAGVELVAVELPAPPANEGEAVLP